MSLGEKSRAMGMAAKNMMISNTKNTLWGFKKLIGRKFDDSQVQAEKAFLPYEVVEGKDGDVAIRVSQIIIFSKIFCLRVIR